MPEIWLVRRGPRDEIHRAPFHPVVICGKRRIAKREAGWTGDAAWVWSHDRATGGGGWLLERWNGFDVDYGGIVRSVLMPDGTDAAFVHRHTGREPWPLIAGAVWWDDKPMPKWLADEGVVYPPDNFSQQRILDSIADDGAMGWGRPRPAHWPEPAPLETWEVDDATRLPNGTTVMYPSEIGSLDLLVPATVVALTATIERPNGRYHDRYTLRFADGSEKQPIRSYVERLVTQESVDAH